jgi:hypothetical protein
MEGACGKIIETDDKRVVIKKVYRHKGPHVRTSSHRAPAQCALQQWASSVLTPKNGFKQLFVPRAWAPEAHQYTMERIDCLVPVKHSEVASELKMFYARAAAESIFPCDYELYRQTNGRVAMIDFDKFAEWRTDGSVLFPWGLVIEHPELPF